jgi:hypothetical protein
MRGAQQVKYFMLKSQIVYRLENKAAISRGASFSRLREALQRHLGSGEEHPVSSRIILKIQG